MNKLWKLLPVAAGCLAFALWGAGCKNTGAAMRNRFDSYNENGYSVGAGEATNVSEIEIEWIAGNVTVVALQNATTVKFAETTTETDQTLLLHSKQQGGVLELKYAGSKAEYSGNMSKDLTVSVPAGLLAELSVDIVSGSVTLEGLSARELSVDTVAGDLTVHSCSFSELAFESMSGSLDLTMADVGFTCEFETLSGSFSDAFGATRNRDTYVYGDGGVRIEVETVSGNLTLRKDGDSQQGGNQGNQGGTQQGGNQGGTQEGGNQSGTQQGGNQGNQGQNPPATGERYERYDDAARYLTGNGSASNVSELEIDWLGGEIVVKVSATASEIVFEETSAPSEDATLRYYRKGAELEIKYAASGALVPSGCKKQLTVTIPSSMSLSALEIEARDNVRVEGVSMRDLSVDTTTGDIVVDGCNFVDGDFETTSGNVELILPDRGFTLEYETFGGVLNDGFGAVLSGRKRIYGNGLVEISVETVTGNLTLRKDGDSQQGGNQGNQGGNQEGGNQGGNQEGGNQGGTQQGGNQGNQGQNPPATGERYERYDDAVRYLTGNGSASNVSELEIDWLGGEIVVKVSATASEIVFEETGAPSEDATLRYYRKGAELEIKYAASGALVPSGCKKQLTVTIPSSMSLSALEIEARDNVRVEGVSMRDLSVDTTTGDIVVDGCNFVDGDFETTSGNVELILPDRGFTLEYETFGGVLNDGFGAVLSGRRRIYGNGLVEISVETVSGNLTLKKI